MRALIAKEWRENRWLILGFILVAPLLSVGLKWGIVGWKETEPVHSVKIVVPILALLYVLAIAADLIASDAASGRIGFLSALPVRASKVWAAKAAFLFGSAAAYLAYLLIVEWVVLGFAGKPAEEIFTASTLTWSYLLVPVAVVGAAAMATSALVDRGLAAAILALLLVGGLGWLISLLRTVGVNPEPDGAVFYVLSALLAVAFLAASWTAFTLGRIHLGRRLRRVVLASAAFLLVIVPPAAWAGARVHRWLHIEPRQEDIRIVSVMEVDPNGNWALVAVTRPGLGPADMKRAPMVEWAVSLESGRVRDLTRLGWAYNGVGTWTEGPGRVVLHREERGAAGNRPTWLRVVYDLERGEIVSTRAVAPDAPHPTRAVRVGPLVLESRYDPRAKKLRHFLLREGREDLEIPEGWVSAVSARDWGIGLLRIGKGEGPKYRILMTDTGELCDLGGWPAILPATPDGHGWTIRTLGTLGRTNCRIDRVPLDGRPAEIVVDGKGGGSSNRPGTRALAYIDGRAWWVDADADAPVALEGIRFSSPEPEIHWSNDGSVCVASDGESAYRITATGDGPRVEEIDPPSIAEGDFGRLRWFDGRRWLAESPREDRLLLLGLDGSTKQLLPVIGEDR